MKKLIFSLVLISSLASAADLENVQVLEATSGQDHVKLKLRTKEAPKDSYFYVDITKSDPDAFGKLVDVTKKLLERDRYKLNLNIKSFSASPSGSYYKSDGITFTGTPVRK